VFKKMTGALERELARDKAREQQQQEAKARQEYKPTPQPEPVVPEPPPAAVSQTKPEPVKPEPAPIVAPVASPREITPPPYAAQQTKPRRKASPAVVTLRIAGAVAGGVGLIGGLVVDSGIQSAKDEYKDAKSTPKAEQATENIDSKAALRNTMYTVAGVGLAGFAVTLFF
jgi:outer membrane biosynthesis protein TonB